MQVEKQQITIVVRVHRAWPHLNVTGNSLSHLHVMRNGGHYPRGLSNVTGNGVRVTVTVSQLRGRPPRA